MSVIAAQLDDITQEELRIVENKITEFWHLVSVPRKKRIYAAYQNSGRAGDTLNQKFSEFEVDMRNSGTPL